MKSPSAKSVRCAIYTRVSTEQGLDQEFNSLDAQYEAASAYIKSQAHAGWTLIRSRYDDGGYSGGSTDRPDLQRLLEDIRARKIDVIVVYKVDRLTRSLADFAKLVELFDAHGVSFVSVTQQFNTTTSMGRLTLNVLLSFAQFEREVTSERIRDKIAASKRKGLWVGGNLPLGYEMKDGKIAIVDEQAELVRSIFRRYLELGGVNELVRDLKERNIKTKIQYRFSVFPKVITTKLARPLVSENAEFGFGQIEPTAALGRVVPFEALDEPARLGRGKGLIERGWLWVLRLSCSSTIFAASGKCVSDKSLSTWA
jgi:site-specific DNA recombinase